MRIAAETIIIYRTIETDTYEEILEAGIILLKEGFYPINSILKTENTYANTYSQEFRKSININ